MSFFRHKQIYQSDLEFFFSGRAKLCAASP